MRDEDAQEEDDETNAGANPSVQDVRCRLVEERLVLLEIILSASFIAVVSCPSRRRTLWSLLLWAVKVPKGVAGSSIGSIAIATGRVGGRVDGIEDELQRRQVGVWRWYRRFRGCAVRSDATAALLAMEWQEEN